MQTTVNSVTYFGKCHQVLRGIVLTLLVLFIVSVVVNQRYVAVEPDLLQFASVDTPGRFPNVLGYTNRNSTNGNNLENISFDIHFEHKLLGHTGEVEEDNHEEYDYHKSIAVGGGITSAKLKGITTENISEKFQFFLTLLPSFCKTISKGYHYHFYLAYDHTDSVFSNKNLLEAFKTQTIKMTDRLCPKTENTKISIHMIQCSHSKKPAWAQNDAMMEAYLDGMEYFYRINDDTVLSTPGWVEEFIKTLSSFKLSKVGVVGPKHSGGNTAILTYDFVHRTHVDIFGYYYPHKFTDWYADGWITKVYQPDNMKKLSKIHVRHTMKLGQRYRHHGTLGKSLPEEVEQGKKIIQRYMNAPRRQKPSDSNKIISMSLYGNIPKFTMGAIRNAQLVPVFFPEWTLRIYTPRNNNRHKVQPVPSRIVKTLKRLGAEVVYANSTSAISPKKWSYLVLDDDSVNVFIVRKPQCRLSNRDRSAVIDWLEHSKEPFHCVRDHPKHESSPIVEGLWGGRNKKLKSLLNVTSVQNLLEDSFSKKDVFLSDSLWPLIKDNSYCQDSISQAKWPSSKKFPVQRSQNLEYLGEEFDIYENSLASDKNVFKSHLV